MEREQRLLLPLAKISFQEEHYHPISLPLALLFFQRQHLG